LSENLQREREREIRGLRERKYGYDDIAMVIIGFFRGKTKWGKGKANRVGQGKAG
jgi:hypothetical protein